MQLLLFIHHSAEKELVGSVSFLLSMTSSKNSSEMVSLLEPNVGWQIEDSLLRVTSPHLLAGLLTIGYLE